MPEFKTYVSTDVYMDFLNRQKHYNITQTPMWAGVKNNWESCLCGLFDRGEMVGGAMALIYKLPANQKFIYVPRGYVLDYLNKDYLNEFTRGIKEYAEKIGAYMVRIDPEIILSKMQNNICEYDSFASEKMENLKNCGHIHKGYAKDFRSYTQPRYNSVFPLADKDKRMYSDEEILLRLNKKIRKKIGVFTSARGIYFETDNTEEAVSVFAKIEKRTADRHNIMLRDENYFRRIYESFNDDVNLFFARMDLERYIEFIKKGENLILYETEFALEDAERLRNEKGNILTLAGLLTVKSNDTAYVLYGGFDDSVFPKLSVNYQLRYEALRFYRDMGLNCLCLLYTSPFPCPYQLGLFYPRTLLSFSGVQLIRLRS